MGRVASDHLGQGTSFLIEAIAMQHAEKESERRLVDRVVPEILAKWTTARRKEHKIEQIMP